jgi:4-amino-4-deoxy-L-arabinose transferase-like glycosyltransferase
MEITPPHRRFQAIPPHFIQWGGDVLWCNLLALYILAGLHLTPFHGDEAMLIYASQDFRTAFLEGQPWQLTTQPPYQVDSDPHLRILNGSLMPHLFGLSLWIGDLENQRPTRLWQWGQSYDENLALGSRPGAEGLQAARWMACLALALSLIPLFGLGRYWGGRKVAYLATLLYASSPVILVNGRRAMHEGGLLLFGLMLLWATAWMLQQRSPRWAWLWVGLLLGLTLATKHSGVVYGIIALGWWALDTLWRMRIERRFLWSPVGRWLGAAMLGIGVFIALSPALWDTPPARLGDLLRVRAELLESQTQANGATDLRQRAEGILRAPYLEQAQIVEVAFWQESESFRAEVNTYQESLWQGLHWPRVLAWILTGLAVVGLLGGVTFDGQPRVVVPMMMGLWVWLGVVSTTLLVNPLPWQRYALPLYPLAHLLTALGAWIVLGWLRRWVARKKG